MPDKIRLSFSSYFLVPTFIHFRMNYNFTLIRLCYLPELMIQFIAKHSLPRYGRSSRYWDFKESALYLSYSLIKYLYEVSNLGHLTQLL